jgi:hypothetical protein
MSPTASPGDIKASTAAFPNQHQHPIFPCHRPWTPSYHSGHHPYPRTPQPHAHIARRRQAQPETIATQARVPRERLFHWKGINTPPLSTIDNAFIQYIECIASRASLWDTASYGAGLRKFHVFCNVFSIPEAQRLPASFKVLRSFALWVVTDPDSVDPAIAAAIPIELISVVTARKYPAAIRA